MWTMMLVSLAMAQETGFQETDKATEEAEAPEAQDHEERLKRASGRRGQEVAEDDTGERGCKSSGGFEQPVIRVSGGTELLRHRLAAGEI